jgi:23S rRNA (guanosine2251-2'-O)-methyltransferase
MRDIILIAHNVRSAHNVGSLLRTCEGLGIHRVYLTGYTPYPHTNSDARLPHLSQKIDKQISKTALGAEREDIWQQSPAIEPVLENLRKDGYRIVALEQISTSQALPDFKPPQKLVLLVGREVEGLEESILALCDEALEIPMFGQKESFNVVQAAAMALYHCRFYPFT